MRPMKISTLKDLEAYVILAYAAGLRPHDKVLIEHANSGDLVTPTFVTYTTTPLGRANGEVSFTMIDYWTSDQHAAAGHHIETTEG